MSYKITTLDYFNVAAKRLAKKYPSFKKDLETFAEKLLRDPLQGAELSPGIRKIRMSIKSKGKGKSGGARVITYNLIAKEQKGEIILMLIYDKEETSSVKVEVLKQILKEEGFM